jgi:energy-coupling factor transporter transmembrane protein EcfT
MAAAPAAPLAEPRELSVLARAAWAVGLTVAAALTDRPLALVVLAALAVLGFALSGRMGSLVPRLPSVLLLALFAFAINAAAQVGHPEFPAWAWSPSVEGLRLGALMAARLVVTVLAFGWLLAAVSPASAADALSRALGNVPGRFAQGLVLTALVALRFGPLAAVEARRLRRTVALRAGRRPGLWAAPAIAVPLVLSATRRADRLAYVLAARHYGVGPRTRGRAMRGDWRNGGLLALGAGVALAALALHG